MVSPSQRLTIFLSLSALCHGAMVLQHRLDVVPHGFVSNGPAPATEMITVQLALTSNDLSGLERKLMAISDPESPERGQFLTQEETKAFVQPSAETVTAVNAWASANGIKTTITSPHEEWISITVPISQADQLFDAQFHTFTHTISNTNIVRTLSFSFPSELVGHVTTAHPTTSFADPNSRLSPRLHSGRRSIMEKRQVDPSCNSTITPSCLEALYGIPTTAATQKNNTLLVTGYAEEFPQTTDLESFLSQFQPHQDPSTTFTVITTDNGTDTQSALQSEANLDIEYTVGIALGVPVTFLSVGGDDILGAFLDTTRFLDGVANPPTVMTTSFGANESSVTPSLAIQICNGYMALGVRGISVIFSSGDGGVRGLHDSVAKCSSNIFEPVFPASCPFVTSVGATIGINPERAINFTGGGFSNVFARPSYQERVVPEFLATLPRDFAGEFDRFGRGYPDVSTQGWNFVVVDGGEASLDGGTSASSPVFASVIALINDRLVEAGKPVLGFLNPFLYSTASGAFTDVTIGKNTGFHCTDNATAFTATRGWDPVTGFGTPVFSKLLTAAVGNS